MTSIKGHNSLTNLQKMTGCNLNLDLVNINAHEKFGQMLLIRSQDIELKRNSDISQGPLLYFKCVQIMCNNPNLDLVSINAYAKFGKIARPFGVHYNHSVRPSVRPWSVSDSQAIERKHNYDGMTDGRNDGQPKYSIAPLFQSGTIIKKIARWRGKPCDFIKLSVHA